MSCNKLWLYLNDVAANHQRIILAEKVSKVDERWSHVWQSGHDENLWRVSFHVFLNVT